MLLSSAAVAEAPEASIHQLPATECLVLSVGRIMSIKERKPAGVLCLNRLSRVDAARHGIMSAMSVNARNCQPRIVDWSRICGQYPQPC